MAVPELGACWVTVLTAFGTAGQHDPVYAGTLTFGIVGLVLLYLGFVNDEMHAGLAFKGMTLALLVLSVVSAFWPLRPWPH